MYVHGVCAEARLKSEVNERRKKKRTISFAAFVGKQH